MYLNHVYIGKQPPKSSLNHTLISQSTVGNAGLSSKQFAAARKARKKAQREQAKAAQPKPKEPKVSFRNGECFIDCRGVDDETAAAFLNSLADQFGGAA